MCTDLRIFKRTIRMAGCVVLMFSSVSFAQTPAAVQTQKTSTLLTKARKMMEDGQSAELLPYLKEILVRLEGNTADDALDARGFCMYQIGVCLLQTGKYAEAVVAFEAFIKAYPDDSSASLAALLAAESYALMQNWPATEKAVRPLLTDPRFDDKRQLTVLQILSEALYRQQKWPEATVPLLEVFRRSPREESRSNAALMLVVCYAKGSDFENLNRFVPFCGDSVRQDAGLNMALIEAGDKKSVLKDYQDALKLYEMVYKKQELIVFYERQLEDLRKILELPFVQRVGATRSEYDEERRSKQLKYDRMVEQLKKIKEGADYDLNIEMRTARCYAGLQRQEEAYAIYTNIYTRAPEHELAEESRFQAFMILLNRPPRQDAALREGRAYLELYPAHRYTDEVSLNLMQLLLAAGRLNEAQAMGSEALHLSPNHRFMDQVRYLLSLIDFQKRNFASARDAFTEVRTRWPKGQHAEAAEYWQAMCCLFMAQYDEAIAALEAYLKNPAYPKKAFEEEAYYRLGVALYGKKDFPGAEKALRRFVDGYPVSPLRSEAFCMLGDLHSKAGTLDVALGFYSKGLDAAANNAQASYAVFQTAGIYERQKNYQAIIGLMEKFIKDRDAAGDPSGAAYWMGKAYGAMNQDASALEIYMNTVTRYGNTPRNDSVDLILREMAGGFKRQTNKTEFLNTLAGALQQAEARKEETLALRFQTLLAYIAEGAARELPVRAILKEDHIGKAGALTLVLFAKESLRRGENGLVYKACAHFSKDFESSEFFPDMMNSKLGALVQDGKYREAVVLAEDITARAGHSMPAGLARKLKADALRLLKQYDAAIKTYNELFAVRDWRGPLIPESLYQIGICLEAQGKTREAVAYFQRVYVLYETHVEWSAKSYEGSIRCLEKLGRNEEMLKTIREMLANADIAATPEGKRAQAILPGGGI